MRHRPERSLALLAALIAGPAVLPASADGPVATGTIRLASGRVARYSDDYNRNALAGADVASDAIVALTEAGSLLRFDRPALALTRESPAAIRATCLGRGEGGALLAGFADGRIARVDPASLALSEIARVPGRVQWVGIAAVGAKPRLFAIAERTEPFKLEGTEYQVPASIVHEPGSDRTYRIEPRDDPRGNGQANAFLLDRRNRLWMGADRGEWGGWCASIDLDSGRVRMVPGLTGPHDPDPYWLGVRGFVERPDGQVWAHGGAVRGAATEGFIWRVDRDRAEELYRLDSIPPGEKERRRRAFALAAREAQRRLRADSVPPVRGDLPAEPESAPESAPGALTMPADRPCAPISQVVAEPGGDSLLVVASGTVYRTDAKLARWEKAAELKLTPQWGYRGGAVGVDSVRAALPAGGPGRSPGWVFATAFDGLVGLDDGRAAGHALPGQFRAGPIARIVATGAGVLSIVGGPMAPGGSDDGTAWRHRGGGWARLSFAPPYEPDPRAPDALEEPKARGWYGTKILVDRDGSVISVSASSWVDPGTVTTARWRGDRPEVLGRQVAALHVAACFATPDGSLWNAEGGALRRFAGGKWNEATAPSPDPEAPRPEWSDLQLNLVAIHRDGPPWILHDPDHRLLFRLSDDGGAGGPKLAIESPPELGTRRVVRDAITWKAGELLLATDDGLRTLTIRDGRVWTPRLETGGRLFGRLARDGRGRLWLGGEEGLAVLVDDGKTLQPLDEVPMIGRARIEALAADPDHPDGAIAAVEGRGVVFIRLDAARTSEAPGGAAPQPSSGHPLPAGEDDR